MSSGNAYRRLVLCLAALLALPFMMRAQQMTILSGKEIPEQWGITRSNLFQLSGITPVKQDGSSYIFAVVTDKAHGGGIFYLSVNLKDKKGTVEGTGLYPLEGTVASTEVRDPEGIIRIGENFWVSGEDQRIVEYDPMGYPTGRELSIPEQFQKQSISPNLGFESLTYDAGNETRPARIWTTTENSILSDKDGSLSPMIRIQSFDPSTLTADRQFIYHMDPASMSKSRKGATYVYGVSDMLALPDGRLVVMEREVCANVKRLKLKSIVKLYVVDPRGKEEGEELEKTLLHSFTTGLRLSGLTLANYEGMCLVTMPDGGDAILLVNDSQGQMGYSKGKLSVHLNDYIRIVRL